MKSTRAAFLILTVPFALFVLSPFLALADDPAPAALQADSVPLTSLPIPARQPDALTGSAFYTAANGLSVSARQEKIFKEITHGNVPDFMRTLKPITSTAVINSVSRTATFYVAPDYVCVGSDTDFFRLPMTPMLAQQIADVTSCTLPTRKMVNSIYAQATVKLAPQPISPTTTDITLFSTFYQHNSMIETSRAGNPLGGVVGGIKKDIVVTPRLLEQSNRVAIYGWHQLDGTPIQPLTIVHGSSYMDYSHGVRLVRSTCLLDGAPTTVKAIIADPVLNVLLSDEGANTVTTYPIPNPILLKYSNPLYVH